MSFDYLFALESLAIQYQWMMQALVGREINTLNSSGSSICLVLFLIQKLPPYKGSWTWNITLGSLIFVLLNLIQNDPRASLQQNFS